MENGIKLGYELGTDKPISIPESHLIVTGITSRSGKTTTLQSLIKRSNKKAIVFTTKIGEAGFTEGKVINPYLFERSDWQYVESLLVALMKEKFKFERSSIMQVCKNTKCLRDVKNNIDAKLNRERISSVTKNVYITLSAYFDLIFQHMGNTKFSKTLELHDGINIMDLENFKEEIQSLVIRSVLETILNEFEETIVVIPEAWKFLPQNRGNPCKYTAESFIRQGATNGNYLWIDSQDMAGVDKSILKQVSTWVLGLQQERNEVDHTIDQIPLPKQQRPVADDIMRLQLGQFYVCTPDFTKKVYVQPVWVDDETAIQVSKGLKKADELVKPKANIEYNGKPVVIETVVKNPQAKFELKPVESKPQETKMLGESKDCKDGVSCLETSKEDEQSELIKLRKEVTELRQHIAEQNKTNKTDADTIAEKVLEKLQKASEAKVASKEGTMIKDAMEKILDDIKLLNEDERKVFLYLEYQNRGIGFDEITENCLRREKIFTMFKRLEVIGIAKYDVKGRLCSSTLKAKIKNALTHCKLKETDIDTIYNKTVKVISEIVVED